MRGAARVRLCYTLAKNARRAASGRNITRSLLAKAISKARAEGDQTVRAAGGAEVVDGMGFGDVIIRGEAGVRLGWGWGFIVRDDCVGTGFRDTGVSMLVMERVFYYYKPLRE